MKSKEHNPRVLLNLKKDESEETFKKRIKEALRKAGILKGLKQEES